MTDWTQSDKTIQTLPLLKYNEAHVNIQTRSTSINWTCTVANVGVVVRDVVMVLTTWLTHCTLSIRLMWRVLHSCGRTTHGLNVPNQHFGSVVHLGSFPGRSQLHSSITCNTQIRRGKAQEVWSCAVMSGRLVVGTWGGADRNNNSCFAFTHPKNEWY